MRQGFEFSYLVLCVVVVLQALALREALRRAAKLSRVYGKREDLQKREAVSQAKWTIRAGTRAPEFSAPLLGGDGIVTRADLEGRETVLFFVSPTDAMSSSRHRFYHQMGGVFQSMWEAVEGELYVVCKGSREECERLTEGSQAKCILDDEGRLFSSFLIDKTPRAVELDEEARVTRFGEPEENESTQERLDLVGDEVATA